MLLAQRREYVLHTTHDPQHTLCSPEKTWSTRPLTGLFFCISFTTACCLLPLYSCLLSSKQNCDQRGNCHTTLIDKIRSYTCAKPRVRPIQQHLPTVYHSRVRPSRVNLPFGRVCVAHNTEAPPCSAERVAPAPPIRVRHQPGQTTLTATRRPLSSLSRARSCVARLSIALLTL